MKRRPDPHAEIMRLIALRAGLDPHSPETSVKVIAAWEVCEGRTVAERIRVCVASLNAWRKCDGCSGDECDNECPADQDRDIHSDEFEEVPA